MYLPGASSVGVDEAPSLPTHVPTSSSGTTVAGALPAAGVAVVLVRSRDRSSEPQLIAGSATAMVRMIARATSGLRVMLDPPSQDTAVSGSPRGRAGLPCVVDAGRRAAWCLHGPTPAPVSRGVKVRRGAGRD